MSQELGEGWVDTADQTWQDYSSLGDHGREEGGGRPARNEQNNAIVLGLMMISVMKKMK